MYNLLSSLSAIFIISYSTCSHLKRSDDDELEGFHANKMVSLCKNDEDEEEEEDEEEGRRR